MNESLNRLASEGATIRELMKHPGMELLRKALEAEAGKDYRKWALELDPKEAEKLRIRAQGYELFFTYAKGFMIRGDDAQRKLNDLANADKPAFDERTIDDQPPA